jgi:hypothetical protein
MNEKNGRMAHRRMVAGGENSKESTRRIISVIKTTGSVVRCSFVRLLLLSAVDMFLPSGLGP